MTNDNPLINLRNRAIAWIVIAFVALIGSWWIYGFFGGASTPVIKKIEQTKTTITLIQKE